MAETDAERLERVLVVAEYSESWDAILLATEVRRLRKIEGDLKHAAAMKRKYAEAKREDSAALYWVGAGKRALERLDESKALDAEADELEKILGTART